MIIFKPLVLFLVFVKKNIPWVKTFHLENIFVFIVLSLVALLSGKEIVEWLGVLAVFVTFNHISVANRLEEAEDMRNDNKESIIVSCYKKQTYYFYIKEILWFIYFVFLGAWSALAGVILFLMYPFWRKSWRKFNK